MDYQTRKQVLDGLGREMHREFYAGARLIVIVLVAALATVVGGCSWFLMLLK